MGGRKSPMLETRLLHNKILHENDGIEPQVKEDRPQELNTQINIKGGCFVSECEN